MSQIFTIQDNKIVINDLVLTNTSGDVTHSGNLSVNGTLTVDQLIVNYPGETVQNTPELTTNWTYNTEDELNGKGLNWTYGTGNTNLLYRNGRIWSNSSIDLAPTESYKIDNTTVISLTELGSQVTKSKLKEVGTLKSLTVLGDTTLSEFAFFNSSVGRLGLNTTDPNAALDIIENNVEIVVGSPEYGVANIGTHSNHHLAIITDNTPRITVKNNGSVVFGNENTKTASVTVHGTLTVDTLISDTRIDRYSSLEFKTSRDSSVYGKGLVWTGTGNTRQFMLMSTPDRLWTTESVDLAEGQCYYVNARPVLSETSLGDSVTKSNLSKVGLLESLNVIGETHLQGNTILSGLIDANSITLNNVLTVNGSGLKAETNISVKVSQDEVLYADNNEIILGNKLNVRRAVKVYGPVSVGVSNPDPDMDLTVKGNISFANRKFITGNSIPLVGSFNIGDICWNNSPQPDSYIGWVCINGGAPGVWAPFGTIGKSI